MAAVMVLRKAAGMLVIASVALAALPAQAQGSTAGYGIMSLVFPGCPADEVVVVGFNDGFTWDWLVIDTNDDVVGGCVIVDGNFIAGPDAFAGGCGFGVVTGGMCLSAGIVSGNTVTYTAVRMCFNDIFSFCITGSGSLTLM